MIELREEKLLLGADKQRLIREFLPSRAQLLLISDFFSVLSDETRVKILSALAISDMCVSDIALLLDINQTTVSHQLKTLRSAGIVSYRRQGRVSFYSLSDKRVLDVLLLAAEKAN